MKQQYPSLDPAHDAHEVADGDEEPPSRGARLYTVNELASEFDVTPRTPNVYEEHGLLDAIRIKGRVFFSERQHQRFAQILRGRALGYTLKTIKRYLALRDDDFIRERPTEALEQNNAAMEDLLKKKYCLEQEIRDVRRVQNKCLKEIKKRRPYTAK